MIPVVKSKRYFEMSKPMLLKGFMYSNIDPSLPFVGSDKFCSFIFVTKPNNQRNFSKIKPNVAKCTCRALRQSLKSQVIPN